MDSSPVTNSTATAATASATVTCVNDSLWLLSETHKESHAFVITGGVLSGMILIGVIIATSHCASERSPLKTFLQAASPRRREMWMNLFAAVALVSLNLLLLGGIQISFTATFITILVSFGVFSLVLSVAGIFFFAHRLGKVGGSNFAQKSAEFLNIDNDAINMNIMVANDRYEDFGNDMFGTVWLGLAQIILLGMYVFSVYQNLSDDFGTSAMMTATDVAQEVDITLLEDNSGCNGKRDIYGPFYALALFVQIGYVFGKDAVKSRFSRRFFWAKAIRACIDKREFEWSARDSSRIKPFELFARGALNVIVNDVGLILLILVLPLQLSVVTRVGKFAFADHFSSFVLDAVATYYIVEVDDINEKKYTLSKKGQLDDENLSSRQEDVADDDEASPEASSYRYGSDDVSTVSSTFSETEIDVVPV